MCIILFLNNFIVCPAHLSSAERNPSEWRLKRLSFRKRRVTFYNPVLSRPPDQQRRAPSGKRLCRSLQNRTCMSTKHFAFSFERSYVRTMDLASLTSMQFASNLLYTRYVSPAARSDVWAPANASRTLARIWKMRSKATISVCILCFCCLRRFHDR